MTHYTLVYRTKSRNITRTQLAALLMALPRDANLETELALTLVSDVTSTSMPDNVVRTIIYSSAGAGPVADGNPIAQVLANVYTHAFSQGIVGRVAADPVVVS